MTQPQSPPVHIRTAPSNHGMSYYLIEIFKNIKAQADDSAKTVFVTLED